MKQQRHIIDRPALRPIHILDAIRTLCRYVFERKGLIASWLSICNTSTVLHTRDETVSIWPTGVFYGHIHLDRRPIVNRHFEQIISV